MVKSKSILIVATFFLGLSACNETPEVFYSTYNIAVSSGAIHRGWIPEWLPKSAYDIHEIHNLDNNRSQLSFSYLSSDSILIDSSFIQVIGAKLKDAPFKVSWWPNDIPPSDYSSHRHIHYSCEGGRAFLALNTNKNKAYYWRP